MDVPGPSSMSTYAQWAHMVECPICYSLYDKPMQMSCGHTLCSSCIGQLVDQVRRNPDENGPRVNLAILEGGALVGAGVGNFLDQFEEGDQQFLEIPRMDQRDFQNMRGMIAIPQRRTPGTTIKCPECRNPTFVPNDGLPVNYRVQELVAKVAPMFKDRHLIKHCSQCEEVLSQGVYFTCTQCTENCTKICSTCVVRSHNGHKIDEVRVLTSKDVREMKSKIEGYQQEALQALEEVKPRLADIGGSIESETMQKLNEFAKVFENMIESFDSKIEEHTTAAELEVEVKKAADVSELFKGSLKRLNDGLFTAIKDAVTKFWDPFEKMRVQIGFVPTAEPAAAAAPAQNAQGAQNAQNARAQEDIAVGEAAAVAAAHAVIQPINRRPNEAMMRNRNAQQAAAHFGNVQRQRQRQRQFPGPPMQQIFQHMMMNMPQQQPQNQMQVMRGPPQPPQPRPMQQVMHHHHHAMPPQMQPGMAQPMQPMNMFPQMQQQQQQPPQAMHPRPQQQLMGQMMNHHPQQQFQNMHMAPQRQMHPHPQMMQQAHPQQPMHMHMGAPQNQQMQMQMQRHPNDPRDFGPQQQPPPAPRMNMVQRVHPQFVQQQAHEQQVQMQQVQMQQGPPGHQQQVALRAQQPPVDIPQGPWVQQMPAVNQEQPPQFPFNDGEIAEVHEAAEAEQEEPEEPVQQLNPEIDAFRVANANMQEYHDMRDRLQADAIVIEDVDVNLADEMQPMDAENAAIQMAPDMIGAQEGFAHFQEMRQEVDAIGVNEFNDGAPGEDIQEQQQGFIELYENPQVDDRVAEEAEDAPQEAEIIEEHPVIVIDDREEEQDVVGQQNDRNQPRRSTRRDNSIEVSPELRRSARSAARNAAQQEEAASSSGPSDQAARSPSPSNVPKRRRVDRKTIAEDSEEMDVSNDAPAEPNRPAKRRATTSTSQSAASSSSNGAPATRRNPRS